eukprot:m.95617 g.95617  ORF g.95617 m.95617 type:complete len:89 (+) comp20425_c1_seq3:28-294(+)
MGMPTAGGKKFQQTPPEKGSFPLDHDGECKPQKAAYMDCLAQNGNNSRVCREASKVYLECRMAKQLMSKEEMRKLGFSSAEGAAPAKK